MDTEKPTLWTDPNFKSFMEERLQSYAFLAAAYQKEIPLVFLEALVENPLALDGKLGIFITSLPHADLEQVRTDLAADYAQLFLGMSQRPVPPYESVYTSEKELLMQDAYLSVKRLYEQKGYVKDKEFNLPEDHIALELEFLTFLIKDCLNALESGDEELRESSLEAHNAFVKEHLLNWVFKFCDNVDERAKTDFYKGISELTRDGLQIDAEYFGLNN